MYVITQSYVALKKSELNSSDLVRKNSCKGACFLKRSFGRNSYDSYEGDLLFGDTNDDNKALDDSHGIE